MNNNYQKLTFDSELFGFDVALIENNINKSNLLETINQAKKKDIKLLYYIAKQKDKNIDCFVNNRVMFEKNVLSNEIDLNKFIYKKDIVDKELYTLSIKSGLYSRFAMDKKLGSRNFEKMYKTWIDNLIKPINNQQVLVIYHNKIVVAFVAITKKDKLGYIQLIAVDDKFRNKGYGKKLLDIANVWFYKMGCLKVLVGTQMDNNIAIKFYKKNGFLEKYNDFAHHIWL